MRHVLRLKWVDEILDVKYEKGYYWCKVRTKPRFYPVEHDWMHQKWMAPDLLEQNIELVKRQKRTAKLLKLRQSA